MAGRIGQRCDEDSAASWLERFAEMASAHCRTPHPTWQAAHSFPELLLQASLHHPFQLLYVHLNQKGGLGSVCTPGDASDPQQGQGRGAR